MEKHWYILLNLNTGLELNEKWRQRMESEEAENKNANMAIRKIGNMWLRKDFYLKATRDYKTGL